MRELLNQGLIMTVLGMGLVFAGLGVLWGVMALLTRLFKSESTEAGGGMAAAAASTAPIAAISAAEALTAERGRVAAIVAGALMANALPLEVPLGPVFEHGRTAPMWVSANRARALQSWQPPRFNERVITPE